MELFICQEQCLILHTSLLELLQAALFKAGSRITGCVCFRSSFLACPGEGCLSPGCGDEGSLEQRPRLAETALYQKPETDPVMHGRASRFRGTIY